MKTPNKLYRSIGPKTALGQTFRKAHYHRAPSLRSAFRGVEWMIAGTFSGATLCKQWVQKFMAAMSKMNKPYQGKRLSKLFSMMAGYGRRNVQPQGPNMG